MVSFERQPKPAERVELAKQAIISADEYAELKHKRPYVYEVESGEKKVTYFGPKHSWDPDDPTWEQIETKFNEANPDIVLVEGISTLKDKKQHYIEAAKKHDKKEFIRRMGEAGLAIKLAVDNEADFDCPEPPFSEEIKYLESQGFSKDEIFGYYVFRMVPQLQNSERREDFKQYMQGMVDNIRENTNWDDYDYSYEHADELSKRWWGEGIENEDKNFFADKVDPIPWKENAGERSRTNLVATTCTRYRDERIIEAVYEKLKDHDKIFIVYGASHAVMQEPAIRKLLEDEPFLDSVLQGQLSKQRKIPR